jgi:hypothetical protein
VYLQRINKDLLLKEATPDYKVTFTIESKRIFRLKKELFMMLKVFFELNNYFYLFTKDRSKDFKGMKDTHYIRSENKAGHHKANY